MNNEPVAWMLETQRGKISCFVKPSDEFDWIPLYTHQAKELNAGGEPVKNATYWKRQYNEMSALNDRLKSSLYHANEQIKYLELHPAKTLTDEEILNCCKEGHEFYEPFGTTGLNVFKFARAILRKAQEK